MSVAGLGTFFKLVPLLAPIITKKNFVKGPIVFPPLITYLLLTYGVNGTILILGGISVHTVMAALMLQPIKWHMKRSILKSEEEVLMHADDSDEKSDEVFVKPGFYIGIREGNLCNYLKSIDTI